MYIKCYVIRVITLSVSITVNVLGQSEARTTNGPMRIHYLKHMLTTTNAVNSLLFIHSETSPKTLNYPKYIKSRYLLLKYTVYGTYKLQHSMPLGQQCKLKVVNALMYIALCGVYQYWRWKLDETIIWLRFTIRSYLLLYNFNEIKPR